jgi:hypothetical protein
VATPTISQAERNIASDIGGALNLYSGITSGTTRGEVSAATSAAKLGASVGQQTGTLSAGTAGTVGTLAADVANLANIYTGIQRGGAAGYGSAAVNAGAMYGRTGLAGSTIAGEVAGPLASAYSMYEFARNWQSGATGSEALQGASTGATVGATVGSFVPGIGTAIGAVAGAVIGGAVGAISSAFGGGRTSGEALADRSIDAELANAKDPQRADVLNQMNPSSAFQMINGYMNAHDSSPGHSEQIQQVFGKNGVSNMMGQMLPAINQAIAQNPSLKNASPQQLYSQVVAPWLQSKGATINPNTRDVKGNPEGQNLIDAITTFIGDWQSGKATSSTRLGINGETLNMPKFASTPSTPAAAAQAQQRQQTVQQAMQPVNQAATSLGNIFGGGPSITQQLTQQLAQHGGQQIQGIMTSGAQYGTPAFYAQQAAFSNPQQQLGSSGTYLDNSSGMGWLSTLGQQTW